MASRVGIESQLADSVMRCVVEEARAFKVVAESADAVGRAQRDWARSHDV